MEPTYPALAVAACEVFDAMTADRAYRKGLDREVAMAEIKGWAPAEVARALEKATGQPYRIQLAGR